MDLTLDVSVLQKAITLYRKHNGRGSLVELQRVSGSNNVNRIEKGTYEPTIDTWLKMHLSMPDVIPPPTTVNGGIITYLGADPKHPLITEEKPLRGEPTLQRLYSLHRSRAVIDTFTGILRKLDETMTHERKAAS